MQDVLFYKELIYSIDKSKTTVDRFMTRKICYKSVNPSHHYERTTDGSPMVKGQR